MVWSKIMYVIPSLVSCCEHVKAKNKFTTHAINPRILISKPRVTNPTSMECSRYHLVIITQAKI